MVDRSPSSSSAFSGTGPRDGVEDPRRDLPSVDAVVRHPDVEGLVGPFSRQAVTRLARRAVEAVRRGAGAADLGVGQRGAGAPSMELPSNAGDRRRRWFGEAITATLEGAAEVGRVGPRRVINATGVVLHTNLGRAPMSSLAVAAVAAVAGSWSDLELDLDGGGRGARHAHVASPVLDALAATCPALDVTGLDALVVNNGAGAILLVLAELARGREVIVSRGHLVEIGGGFRVPDVIRQGGARLVEVGTTNRTRLSDYADAITAETGAILNVHPSNFRIIGFEQSVTMAELGRLGAARGVPVVDDIGSGCLLDTTEFGIAPEFREPRPSESLAAGASVVTFSADKLLGGPQGGIIVGRSDLVARCRRHPLARALRLDKLGIAGLRATLAHYRRGDARSAVPVWRMIGAAPTDLAERASAWADRLRRHGIRSDAVPAMSAIGGGAMPGVSLPTTILRLAPTGGADALASRLRRPAPGLVPVIGRIADDVVVLDPRTVLPGDDEDLMATVHAAATTAPGTV